MKENRNIRDQEINLFNLFGLFKKNWKWSILKKNFFFKFYCQNVL